MTDKENLTPHQAAEPEIPVRLVQLWLCDPCLDGEGGECHTPGCSLWINRAPDISLRDNPMVTILAAVQACGTCDGSGMLTVPDGDGESASEQACPDPAHRQPEQDYAAFTAWREAKGYPDGQALDFSDARDAFGSGMRAARGAEG